MKQLKTVLLVVIVGSLIGCGAKMDDSASNDAKETKATAKEEKRTTEKEVPTKEGKAKQKTTPKTEEPKSPVTDPSVTPPITPAVDPPIIDPVQIIPPIAPTDPGPAVDPSTQPVPQITPSEVSPLPVIPPGVQDDEPEAPKTDDTEAKTSGGRAINLKLADSGKTISAGVGDVIIIELEANPTTGYSWEAKPQAENSILALASKQFLTLAQMNAEIQPMPGQGGVTTFTYKVSSKGESDVSLAYRRPWEKDAEPAKSFSIAVEATEKASPVVTGKIVFNAEPDVEKISRIVVSIRNTALADGPAPLIGTVELKPPFKLPVSFAVPYDPANVRPNPMFYSISVRVNTIVDGSEKLYYINDTHHPVFRDANDTKVDVAVKKLR